MSSQAARLEIQCRKSVDAHLAGAGRGTARRRGAPEQRRKAVRRLHVKNVLT